jgi:hypothetical protein
MSSGLGLIVCSFRVYGVGSGSGVCSRKFTCRV